MSRECFVLGTRVQSGNNVSHSNRKTRRTFLPNIQDVKLYSEALKKYLRVKVTPRGLRTIEHNGGLDNFLKTTSNRKLTADAVKVKRLLSKSDSSTTSDTNSL
jgi:large subunit ribosomal protein L28